MFWRFLGFSFATLTTLGYGNVAPATRQGDAIATAEAVVGQMYVAIVIARIVALQIAAGGDQGAARPRATSLPPERLRSGARVRPSREGGRGAYGAVGRPGADWAMSRPFDFSHGGLLAEDSVM